MADPIEVLYTEVGQNNAQVHIKGRGYGDPIRLALNKVKCRSIEFANCHFQSSLNLSQFSLSGRLTFTSCSFHSEVIIEGLTINNKEFNSIDFHNCNFHFNSLRISDSKFTKSVQIFNCRDFRNISFHNNSLKESLDISNNTVNSELTLFNSEITGPTVFSENELRTFTSIDNTFTSVSFQENTIKGDFLSDEKGVVEYLEFVGGTFSETVTINPIPNIENDTILRIKDGNYSKDFRINFFEEGNYFVYNRNCRNLIIENNIFQSSLFINGGEDYYNFYSESIELNVNISNKFDGFIKVSGFSDIALSLSGENIKGNMSFRNLVLSSLIIDKLTNYNNLQFINCKSYQQSIIPLDLNDPIPLKIRVSDLKFIDSYFDKTHFINCDLSGFTDYELNNNNLTPIRSSNTKWFDYQALTTNFEKKLSLRYVKERTVALLSEKEMKNSMRQENIAQIRETFRQLKYAMESQGERIEALRFKSSEMKAYYRFLSLAKGNWKDRFILWLGQSNDHGLNWWKPILIVIPLMFLLYILIIISASSHLSFFRFNPSSFNYTVNELWNNIYLFPELFNPTHSLDKILPETGFGKNFAASFWDFVSKLILAFFIFQTITAFRKFAK